MEFFEAYFYKVFIYKKNIVSSSIQTAENYTDYTFAKC